MMLVRMSSMTAVIRVVVEERIGEEVAVEDGVANSIRCSRSPTTGLVLYDMSDELE